MSPYREAPKLGERTEPGRWRRGLHWVLGHRWGMRVTPEPTRSVRLARCNICGDVRLERLKGLYRVDWGEPYTWEPVDLDAWISDNYSSLVTDPVEAAWAELEKLPRWR